MTKKRWQAVHVDPSAKFMESSSVLHRDFRRFDQKQMRRAHMKPAKPPREAKLPGTLDSRGKRGKKHRISGLHRSVPTRTRVSKAALSLEASVARYDAIPAGLLLLALRALRSTKDAQGAKALYSRLFRWCLSALRFRGCRHAVSRHHAKHVAARRKAVSPLGLAVEGSPEAAAVGLRSMSSPIVSRKSSPRRLEMAEKRPKSCRKAFGARNKANKAALHYNKAFRPFFPA